MPAEPYHILKIKITLSCENFLSKVVPVDLVAQMEPRGVESGLGLGEKGQQVAVYYLAYPYYWQFFALRQKPATLQWLVGSRLNNLTKGSAIITGHDGLFDSPSRLALVRENNP